MKIENSVEFRTNIRNKIKNVLNVSDNKAGNLEKSIFNYCIQESKKKKIVKKWVPITYEAFIDYRVGGTEVSSKGKEIIKKLIKGENININDTGLSKREWNELMSAFNLNEKIVK